MDSKVVVLDESGKQKGHAILSVGGFVADLADLSVIERRWGETKTNLGLDPDRPVKYSGDWPDRSKRTALIAAIGQFPIGGVIALLEDDRAKLTRLNPTTRSDRYLQLPAFEWVLQRVAQGFYLRQARGPHLVLFDQRSDLSKFEERYAQVFDKAWVFAGNTVPSLATRGFSRTLAGAGRGPLVEIADMMTSGMSRWATVRCAAQKGGTVPELDELNQTCAALAPLFPASGASIPPRRQGFSIVAHAKNKPGLLRPNVDRWIQELL